MLLATALTHHEGALRASLMAEYGLRLGEVRGWPASEVADLVAWLPAGCAFWQDFGGPAALTLEASQLRRVVYWLRVLDYRERGSKGERPQPDPDPPYAHERRAQEDVTSRKARAFQRRQQARGQR